jgi:hypothetical protein
VLFLHVPFPAHFGELTTGDEGGFLGEHPALESVVIDGLLGRRANWMKQKK